MNEVSASRQAYPVEAREPSDEKPHNRPMKDFGRQALGTNCVAKEALYRGDVALRTDSEVDGLPCRVDRVVGMSPLAADPDVSFSCPSRDEQRPRTGRSGECRVSDR